MKQIEFPDCWWEFKMVHPLWTTLWQLSYEFKNTDQKKKKNNRSDLTIPPLDIFPQMKTYILHKDVYIRMFTTPLFKNAQTRNNPNFY